MGPGHVVRESPGVWWPWPKFCCCALVMTFGEADGVPDKTSSVPFFVCLDPSEDEVLGGDENKMHVFFLFFFFM